MGKKIRVTFTVDEDDYDPNFRRYFDGVVRGDEIPKGKLLCRAMYLASREVIGEIPMKVRMDSLRKKAHRAGKKFDDEITLEPADWLNIYR